MDEASILSHERSSVLEKIKAKKEATSAEETKKRKTRKNKWGSNLGRMERLSRKLYLGDRHPT
jgi:hypothetical protein